MKVEQVCTHAVISTRRSSTIEAAADMMRKYHVGALLVMEDAMPREAVGIVTDRDLVLQAVADGLGPRDVSVGDVMTPTVASVDENADLRDALERMNTLGVRRLVVTRSDGDIVGVLSVDDVVDGLASDLATLAHLMKSGMRKECQDYHHGHAI